MQIISYAKYTSLLILVLLLSCKRKGQTQSGLFEKGESKGKVSLKLEEASGLRASQSNPGYYWTLNDSGNPAEIFLLNEKAEIVLTCRIGKIKNRDWEEIAVGRDSVKGINYLYIGEIGDNDAKYNLKYIYRLPEPVLRKDEKVRIDEFDTLIIKLPDGLRDMESMAVDHSSGDIYLISKREKNVHLYILPFHSQIQSDTLVPEKIATLPFQNVVAIDFSFDGREVLMKTYDKVFYWDRPLNASIQQTLLTAPTELNYDPEPQGESIAWTLDGSGFYTLSESVDNVKAKLLFYKRAIDIK